MELPEDIFAQLTNWWPVARFSTITAQGNPHTVPIVFCALEQVIYSPLDGKRKRDARLQRFVNLEGNSNATLLIDEYTPDWQSLWWVRIDGDADWFQPDAHQAGQIANCLLAKYPQYQTPSYMFDTSAYLRLRPTKVTAWAQSDFPETIRAAVGAASRS